MYNIKPTRIATHLIHVKHKDNTAESPYAFDYLLLIEIDETRDYLNGNVYSAELIVYYRVVASSSFRLQRPIGDSFVASYQKSPDSSGGDVRLTSRPGTPRGLAVSPDWIRKMQIGTYLMNQVVRWAKQWPEADVFPIKLERMQALLDDGDNKNRRNEFYEQFEIKFNYDDMATKESGISKPMKAAQLVESEKWRENITEEAVDKHLFDLHQRIAALTRDASKYEKEALRLRELLKQELKKP